MVEAQLERIEERLADVKDELEGLYRDTLRGADEELTGTNLRSIVEYIQDKFGDWFSDDIESDTLRELLDQDKFVAAQGYYNGSTLHMCDAIDECDDAAKWMATHPRFNKAECLDRLNICKTRITADNFEILSAIFTPEELTALDPEYETVRAEFYPLVKSAAFGV